ncbi:hypothetical protein JB92DRAFT_3125838 [Gautieria morchelliformis]|nr:hypothetical protein JB92DRAFT_3125838 [Gautieria morchelliformis]
MEGEAEPILRRSSERENGDTKNTIGRGSSRGGGRPSDDFSSQSKAVGRAFNGVAMVMGANQRTSVAEHDNGDRNEHGNGSLYPPIPHSISVFAPIALRQVRRPIFAVRATHHSRAIKARSTSLDRLHGSSPPLLNTPPFNVVPMIGLSQLVYSLHSAIPVSLFTTPLHVRWASPLPATTPPLWSLRSPFATFIERPITACIIQQQAHHQTQSTSCIRRDGPSLAPSSS